MDTAVTTGGRIDIPRPELHWPGRIAIGGLVLLGIGALAGGLALVAHPDGSVMQFDTALLAGSPFSDYLIPGLMLGGMFGIGSLVVGAMGLRRSRLAPFLAFAIGCAQMIWISVELASSRSSASCILPASDSAWSSRPRQCPGVCRRSKAGGRTGWPAADADIRWTRTAP